MLQGKNLSLFYTVCVSQISCSRGLFTLSYIFWHISSEMSCFWHGFIKPTKYLYNRTSSKSFCVKHSPFSGFFWYGVKSLQIINYWDITGIPCDLVSGTRFLIFPHSWQGPLLACHNHFNSKFVYLTWPECFIRLKSYSCVGHSFCMLNSFSLNFVICVGLLHR